jgi:hypothetical protein
MFPTRSRLYEPWWSPTTNQPALLWRALKNSFPSFYNRGATYYHCKTCMFCLLLCSALIFFIYLLLSAKLKEVVAIGQPCFTGRHWGNDQNEKLKRLHDWKSDLFSFLRFCIRSPVLLSQNMRDRTCVTAAPLTLRSLSLSLSPSFIRSRNNCCHRWYHLKWCQSLLYLLYLL